MTALSAMGRGLCTGRSDLFDSTDPQVHLEAKALCDVCPVLTACAAALDDVKRSGAYAAPSGTWAGEFLNNAEHRNRAAFKAWKAAS